MNTRITIKVISASIENVHAIILVDEQDRNGEIHQAHDDFMAMVESFSEGFTALHSYIPPLDDDTKQKITLYLKGYHNALQNQKEDFFWIEA